MESTFPKGLGSLRELARNEASLVLGLSFWELEGHSMMLAWASLPLKIRRAALVHRTGSQNQHGESAQPVEPAQRSRTKTPSSMLNSR